MIVTPFVTLKRESSIFLVSEIIGGEIVKNLVPVTVHAGVTETLTEFTGIVQKDPSMKGKTVEKLITVTDSTLAASKKPLSPERDGEAEGSAYGEKYTSTATSSPGMEITTRPDLSFGVTADPEHKPEPPGASPIKPSRAGETGVPTFKYVAPTEAIAPAAEKSTVHRPEDVRGTEPVLLPTIARSEPTLQSGVVTTLITAVERQPTSASKPLVTKTQPPLIDREEEDPSKDMVIIDESVSSMKTSTDDDFTGKTDESDIDKEYFTSSSVTAVAPPTVPSKEVLEEPQEEPPSTADTDIGVNGKPDINVFVVTVSGNNSGKTLLLELMSIILF